MSHVPNQQKVPTPFHQTHLNTDEDKLANQSEVTLCCSPALKPLCFPDNFTQNWLDKKCARKYLNPHVIYSEYFLWNVSLILIFPSSSLEAFHTIHQNQHLISRMHQRHASSAWLRETVKLTLVPSNSTDVMFTDSWACEYWPSESVLSSTERRHGTSQLRLLIDETFNMTRQSDSSNAGASLNQLIHVQFPLPLPHTLHCLWCYIGGPAQWACAPGYVLCQRNWRNRS